jgi:hypothetical protein
MRCSSLEENDLCYMTEPKRICDYIETPNEIPDCPDFKDVDNNYDPWDDGWKG